MDARIRAWRQKVDGVLALVNELDPYDLAPGRRDGAPDDEYNPEAEAMARHLMANRAITAEHIDAIWNHWFGEPLSPTITTHRREQFVAHLNRLP